MLKLRAFIPKEPSDHVDHLMAFAEGAKKDGSVDVDVCLLEYGYRECDIAVVFGLGKTSVPASWPRGGIIYEHHEKRKRDFILVERGYVDRDHYYSCAINGLNGRGDFGNSNPDLRCPSDRWNALGFSLHPWKAQGRGNILVCGQVPWDASVQHTDHRRWCAETIRQLRSLTSRKIVFRPHPCAAEFDYGIEPAAGTFDENLSEAHCVVTFNSNAGVMAAVQGVPVFAADPGSMAWPVANRKITKELLENPATPCRKQWAHDLAYAQWTAEDMRSGEPWRRLKDVIEKNAEN